VSLPCRYFQQTASDNGQPPTKHWQDWRDHFDANTCKKRWSVVMIRLTAERDALGCPLSVVSTHSARRSKKLKASFTRIRGHCLRPKHVIREKYRGVSRSPRKSATLAACRASCWEKCIGYTSRTRNRLTSGVASNSSVWNHDGSHFIHRSTVPVPPA
jgi:hypothetical protein